LKYGGVPSVWGGEGDRDEKLFGQAQQENMKKNNNITTSNY